VKLYPVLV